MINIQMDLRYSSSIVATFSTVDSQSSDSSCVYLCSIQGTIIELRIEKTYVLCDCSVQSIIDSSQERHVSTFHKDVANPDFIFYTTAGRGEVR